MSKFVLKVEGMSCGHCVRAIEGAFQEKAVKAKVDLDAKTVTIDGNVSTDTAKQIIEDAGYQVVE
ncbi:heavy-metal-associated domain-containing protein [Risungbinella massiliensis]|uniref:heavy-metal-associated domain-containing protein n=1 Tax=Risungbinella massiliensis TaxID=1329796 RepID=UPI0005CBAB16|nr:cation transporter [Risungbinella massiliensis]